MQGKQLTMLLGVLYGGAFLAGFNENLMNMGLIAIMDEFAIGSVTAQWLVTGLHDRLDDYRYVYGISLSSH